MRALRRLLTWLCGTSAAFEAALVRLPEDGWHTMLFPVTAGPFSVFVYYEPSGWEARKAWRAYIDSLDSPYINTGSPS